MSISMSSASVPICMSMLSNLSHMLDKAQAFVDAKKCDPVALTQYRLAPDMLPFTRQVLIACDAAKNGIARVSGVEAPKFADNEVTLGELKERIEKTLDFLKTVPADKLDGTESREITFPVGKEASRTLQGEAYLKHWMLPNLFFHVTMSPWPTPFFATTASNSARVTTCSAPVVDRNIGAAPNLMDSGSGPHCGFPSHHPVEFGADICHAAGNQHTTSSLGRRLSGVQDSEHSERRVGATSARGFKGGP